MNKNFYTVKKVIRGKEYVAQFSGVSTAVKAIDSSYIEGTSNTRTEQHRKTWKVYLGQHYRGA